jgi:O-antigen ligase
MQKVADENALAKVLYIGAAFVTLFVYTGVSDPVNVTKLVAISAMAFSALGMLLWGQRGLLWKEERAAVLLLGGLLAMGLLSTIASKAPTVQNFYGQSGRQTGLLAYLSLSIIFLAAASLRQLRNIRNVLGALIFAGAFNIIYCAIALWGKDPIPWTNPYGNILGTFGNPDFISAFLGLSITSALALAFRKGQALAFRAVVIPGFILGLYEIKRSHSIQGLVVTGLGLGLLGFFLIRARTQGKVFISIYTILVSVVGLFAIAGALQKGPLSTYIYKRSVSLRGSYWHAGLKMAQEHPIFGVGYDTYGDWYRRSRSLKAATTLPGPTVMSNASHNVFIDAMATNGLIYFAFYLGVIVLVLVASIKVIKRNRQYDGIFVALFIAWSGYQLQSFVSINQIGLAIWGWILGGALIAYERITRSGISDVQIAKPKNRTRRENSVAASSAGIVVVGIAGLVIGLIIALPPFIADGKWVSALKSGNLQNAEKALNSWPMDSERTARASQLFYQNKQEALSLKWAKKTVELNPDYYDGYMLMTFSHSLTSAERSAAEAQMYRLNPYLKARIKK